MARGVGGGAIIQGGRLFLIFPSKGGDYSKDGDYLKRYGMQFLLRLFC